MNFNNFAYIPNSNAYTIIFILQQKKLGRNPRSDRDSKKEVKVQKRNKSLKKMWKFK